MIFAAKMTTWLRRAGALFTLCASLLLLGGCADRAQPLNPSQMEGESAIRWQAFERLSQRAVPSAVLGGSLRFGIPNDTRRVTYLLWSNGDQPLRLDIQAGVGVTAAKVRVADNKVLLFLPQEAKAYQGTDAPEKALSAMGMPMPLSLRNLALFLNGQFMQALGMPEVTGYSPAPRSDGIIYAIQGTWGKSELELSAQGLPVRWSMPRSWTVRVDYDDTMLPRKVEGELKDGYGVRTDLAGYRFILLIKSRQNSDPFSSEELDLLLPAGIQARLLGE